ncbi:MAG: hypothetical protein DWQ01_04915 [Planctomycetota bacterium]|nr:MAG: hypothetical protein DWQ01_04915 [Planctomycetota bacterium]
MSRSLLAAAAVLTLSASLTAQSQMPVSKAVTPKHAGVFSMATGELEPASASERAGLAVIFNASELTNYYSVPGLDQEWLDEGTLLDRNTGNVEQMNCFEFVYCSSEADATQNSGTVTFAYYDETVVCSGPTNGGNFALGGYLCAYDIVGLPLGAANGAIQCWIVTVDLQGGFECPPNLTFDWTTDAGNSKLFGWSFIPRNDNTGPWLSKGGTQAAGIDNSFVWFDQFGALVGCFWFGGTPFASFAMKMWGNVADVRAYYTVANSPADFLVTISANAGGSLTIDGTGMSDVYAVVSLAAADLPAIPGAGALLIDINALATTPIPVPSTGITLNTSVGTGATTYWQCMQTNGGAPSAGNLPIAMSQGARIVLR